MADVKNIKIKVDNNFKQTGKDAEGMNKKLKQTSQASKGLTSSVGGAVKGLFNMQNLMTGFAVGAVVGGIRAVTGVFSSLVSTFSGFSKELSGLQAILGASATDMGKLSDQAKALGASTQFTAKEVVQLQTELAKLGFTTKEIQQSTEATLNLASSLDVGLGEAASLAGSTLRAFGLDASETAKVVDVMAKSSASSALDFSGLQESLKLVAPTSRALGVSIEETTAMLGVLADNGLKGSIAGTGLSKSFIQLTKAGIPLNEALDKVKNSSNQLNTAVELVGVVGAKSLLTLANNAPRIDALTESLNGAEGSAKKLAETRLDNLAGDTTKLGSAWEGFLLSIEDGEGMFNGLLRGIVQATTALLNFLTPTKLISESIAEERTELMMLESELNNTNTTQERRNEIIDNLQEKYPEYLGNIDRETVSNEELSEAINKVSESLINKIIVQEKQEEIEEQAKETAEALLELDEARVKATRTQIEVREKFAKQGRTLAKTKGTEIEQTKALIKELEKEFEINAKSKVETGKTISSQKEVRRGIDNLKSRLRELQKTEAEYNEQLGITNSITSEKNALMERLGISFDSNTKKTKENTEVEDKSSESVRGKINLLKERLKVEQEALGKAGSDAEIVRRNKNIQAIQKELKALQELGIEKSKPKKELTQDQIDARLALEKKANAFSIQFTEETSNKRLQILIKEAETAYNESVRLNEKRIQKEDDQNKLRISLIKDNAEREKEELILSYNDKFEIAEGNAELEIELKKRMEAEINAIDKKSKDDQALRDKKLNAQKVGMASDGFSALSDLVMSFEAKDKESAKRQFKINKALQIGQTIASTASGIMNQLAVPQDALTGLNFVKAGIVATTGAASLVKIASSKFDEGSTGGSSPSIASGGGSQAPSFNVVGNSGINQLAQLQTEPTRAYVVSGEVTSQQSLDRNRQMNATL